MSSFAQPERHNMGPVDQTAAGTLPSYTEYSLGPLSRKVSLHWRTLALSSLVPPGSLGDSSRSSTTTDICLVE